MLQSIIWFDFMISRMRQGLKLSRSFVLASPESIIRFSFAGEIINLLFLGESGVSILPVRGKELKTTLCKTPHFQ